MKRFGILLLSVLLLSGIYAQTETNVTNIDSIAATEVTNDSLQALYEKGELSAKEALLLQKLSADQLLSLEEKRLDNEREALENDLPLPSWAIVMIATSPFLMVILIVFFSIRAKKEREKARYDLYTKSLEAGQPLPEKFFDVAEKKKSNLQRGAIWLAVGLGIFVFGLFDQDTDLMGIGAIPAFVGAAFLLVYFINKRDNNANGISQE